MCSKDTKKWAEGNLGSMAGSNIGALIGGPIGMVIGGIGGAWAGANPEEFKRMDRRRLEFGRRSGFEDAHDPMGIFKEQRSKFHKMYNDRLERRVERAEWSEKIQYDPLAPEKTALTVDTNTDIRNRRRARAMMNQSQLVSPGPGTASGGGARYSGANAPLS